MQNQFGHPSSNKLQKLVKASTIDDKELFKLFDEVETLSKICLK